MTPFIGCGLIFYLFLGSAKPWFEIESRPHLFYFIIQGTMEKNYDYQQIVQELYEELLAVADDHGYSKTSDEACCLEVINDMQSLVRIAKQDPVICDFFLQAGKKPDSVLDALLKRAIKSL